MAAIDIYNSKFYTEFTSKNGTVKRIYLILGDDTDISPSASEYPFPPGTFDLAQGLTIEAGFNDDIPLGLMETPSLEFTVNLHYLNFVETLFTGDTLDWREVRKEIINCQAMSGGVAKTRYKSGVGFECTVQIPNRWYIYDVTNDTMIFDGVQDFNPETTININYSKKQQTTSIVIVHIITQAMKKALPSMYRSLKSWGLATSLANLRVKYFDDWYPIPGGVGFINYYAGVDNNHYSHIVLLKNIIDALHNLIQSIVCVYKRDELATLTITNHPFTSLSFFKTDTHLGQIYKTNDYVNYDTDLVVIEHTLNIPNNTNQGAFVDADGSVWYEKTMFDFFSELVEGNICKTVIDNNGIIYLCTLEARGGSFTINDTDIIKGDVEVVIGGSSYKEFKNNLEGVGDLGIEEFGYQNTQRNNDKSIEIKSLLHNHFCLQEFMYANESNNVCETVHWSPSPFGLYYWDSGLKSYVLVSDICEILIRGFISPVTADLSTAYSVYLHMVDNTNLPTAFDNLVAFCNERYKVSGLGYLSCKALNEIFGNPYTSKITLNLNSDMANWLTIGEYYSINLNSMTDSTYLQPPLRRDNYLVRVTQDLIKDETIATFWTRGT